MADRIIFVGILVLAGVYFWATSQIPTLEIGDPLGPKAFPRLLGGGLLIAAAMLLAEMLKARKSEPEAKTEPAEPSGNSSFKIVAGVVVVTGLYFALFEPLGYAISTSLFLLVMTSYFNKGKRLANVLTSLIYGFASYYMFTTLLGVNLPRGPLPF
ncbi:MAG: tripartite tricarboxylate transporter TctB family protein [Burkholderiales bacterium]